MMAKRNVPLGLAIAAVAWLGTLPAFAKPPAHLVPFPEDQAESRPAKAKTAKPRPPKSNFRPRFRVPVVKRAEHTEPTAPAKSEGIQQTSHEEPAGAPASGATQSAEPVPAELAPGEPAPMPSPDVEDSAAPDATAEPLPVEPAEGETLELIPAESPPEVEPATGRAALNEAYALSKTGESIADYTRIVHLCRRAKALGLNQKYEDYSHRLLGWAFNRRGEARSKAGQHAEALSDFERAVAASGAWRAIHNRGVGYAAVGRLKEAMADLNRAIGLNPRYSHAYYNRGELRYKFKDYPAAVKDYAMAIKLGASDAAVYVSRGHAYYRMERFGDALRDYGEAIKRDSQNASAYINRGDTYSDVGKYGLAAKDYRSAVKVAPNNGRAYQAAAWLMATCPDAHYRDEELAIEAASRAIDLSGPTFRNLSTLAAAQASAGMFDEAQQSQERAITAAAKKDAVTAEKMMSLYRREIAYRDRPFTAFTTPEEIEDKQVRQATALEPARRDTNRQRQAQPRPHPQAQRAWFQEPPANPGRMRRPPPRTGVPPGRPPRSRLFAPRGRI